MFTVLRSKVSAHSNVTHILLILAIVAVLSARSVSADALGYYFQPAHLDGFWEFTMILPPNGILPEKILLLGNFTRDGSFLNSSTHPLIPIEPTDTFPCCILTIKDGHGHWKRTGPRTFLLESSRFVFLHETETFFGYAASQAQVKVNAQGNEMQGRVSLQLLDSNKDPVSPPVFGEITGSRVKLIPIEFPPLP